MAHSRFKYSGQCSPSFLYPTCLLTLSQLADRKLHTATWWERPFPLNFDASKGLVPPRPFFAVLCLLLLSLIHLRLVLNLLWAKDELKILLHIQCRKLRVPPPWVHVVTGTMHSGEELHKLSYSHGPTHLLFWDRVPLCNADWLGIHSVAQAGLTLTEPASAS